MSQEKPHIVSLVPMLPFVEDWLDQAFTVHRSWQAPDRNKFLAEVSERARAIAAIGHYRIDGDLLDRLPNAKIVSLMSVGYDTVDLPAMKARGVALTNTPDVLTDEVADLAIGLVLAAARQIVAGDRHIRSGAWRSKGNMELASGVRGKTLGILGLGRIGHAIGLRAEAFGMKVIYGGRSPKKTAPWAYHASIVELARQSDFLVIAVPGGAETRHMVDAEVLDALGPKGTLVNIARGSVVDERALVAALKEGRLGGAALDVFQDEPNVPEELIAMDHVVLQPHVGSATYETRGAMGRLMIDNLLAHFAGKPLITPVTF